MKLIKWLIFGICGSIHFLSNICRRCGWYSQNYFNIQNLSIHPNSIKILKVTKNRIILDVRTCINSEYYVKLVNVCPI